MKDPQGAPSGFMHVVRGGSWGSPPAIARSATRADYLIPSANIRYYSFGFRVARTVMRVLVSPHLMAIFRRNTLKPMALFGRGRPLDRHDVQRQGFENIQGDRRNLRRGNHLPRVCGRWRANPCRRNLGWFSYRRGRH